MFETSWDEAGCIALVELAHPPANAFGPPQIDALDSLLEDFSRRVGLRAIVFHSRLRFFSTGADIGFMTGLATDPHRAERLAAFSARLQDAFAKLEALPVPTICSLSGACVGGGLEFALACDLRVAETGARIGFPEVKLGLLPGAGGTQRLTKIAGVGAAKRLVMTGELVSGEEAHRLNIVQTLAEGGTGFDTALQLARTLSTFPASALAAIKRCISLAPSDEGYQAEIDKTLALHQEPGTWVLINDFLQRSRRKKVQA